MKSVVLYIALSILFCYAVIHFEWHVVEQQVQSNFVAQVH